MPGFRIEIADGRVSLEHIFRARLWAMPQRSDDLITLTYRKLLEVAEETEVETEVCVAS
jgi:hypothetical protein